MLTPTPLTYDADTPSDADDEPIAADAGDDQTTADAD